MDDFQHIVSRLPHIEHERRYRERTEGELRNRQAPPDVAYPMERIGQRAADPPPDVAPVLRLRRAALGLCLTCGVKLTTDDAVTYESGLDAPVYTYCAGCKPV